MPQIKINPPERLPEGALTEQQFQTYRTELEVYLELEDKFEQFMSGEYKGWTAAEENQDRIEDLTEGDKMKAEHEPSRDRREAADAKLLAKKRKELRLFLSLVAKTVSPNHYTTVMENSISLQFVYDMIRADYDIKAKGIHIFNILDIKYEPNIKPVGFYNSYRTVVMNNMAKDNEPLFYKGEGRKQLGNESISPTFEDFILIEVLRLIDVRLPEHVRSVYSHKVVEGKRIMDFKTDIMINVGKFKKDMDEKEQMSGMRTEAPFFLRSWLSPKYGPQHSRRFAPTPGEM